MFFQTLDEGLKGVDASVGELIRHWQLLVDEVEILPRVATGVQELNKTIGSVHIPTSTLSKNKMPACIETALCVLAQRPFVRILR